MKAPLTKDDFTETNDGMLVAEASDLGLGVREQLPATLRVEGTTYTFRVARRDTEGDIVSWLYQAGSPSNQYLLLYND